METCFPGSSCWQDVSSVRRRGPTPQGVGCPDWHAHSTAPWHGWLCGHRRARPQPTGGGGTWERPTPSSSFQANKGLLKKSSSTLELHYSKAESGPPQRGYSVPPLRAQGEKRRRVPALRETPAAPKHLRSRKWARCYGQPSRTHLGWYFRKHVCKNHFHQKHFIIYFWRTDELKGSVPFLSSLAIAYLSSFVFIAISRLP